MTQPPAPDPSRPRDPVELQVQGIFAEVLGLDEVPIDTPFLDLGGHSLIALQLQDRLLTDLDCDIPLDLLFGSGTVAELARAARHAGGSGTTRRLASLAPPATRELFAVHSVVGTALRYRTLAGLLADDGVQLRAFQARGLTGAVGPHDDLTAMADAYVAELADDTEPAGGAGGPVLLLGYSLGALVAFEIAVRLQDKGIGVDHLFLVDTYAPVPAAVPNLADGLTPAGMLAQSLDGEFDLTLLDGVAPADEPALLLDHARARARVPETYTTDDVARLLAVVTAHAEALERYPGSAGRRVTADATLFTVRREESPPDMWWGEAVAGELSVVELRGPHHLLLDPPDVETIARRIADVAGAA